MVTAARDGACRLPARAAGIGVYHRIWQSGGSCRRSGRSGAMSLYCVIAVAVVPFPEIGRVDGQYNN